MEAAMKLAADRDEARKEQERDEEAARGQPLLNDTSFDRRRTVAVYKGDGTRGHHMQVSCCLQFPNTVPALRLPSFISISAADRANFVPVRTTKTCYGLWIDSMTYKCCPK